MGGGGGGDLGDGEVCFRTDLGRESGGKGKRKLVNGRLKDERGRSKCE